MKKISTLCLTLVMLLMVMMHVAPNAQAAEGEKASLTYTIVNEANPNGTNSATVEVTLGNEVGISLGVNEQFGYYIHAGDMITDASQKFIASASNHVVVVMKDSPSDTVATFVDTNGEFLGAIYNPTLDSEELDISVSKPGFKFVGFDDLEAGVDKVYVAKYTRTNQDNISVTVEGGSIDLDVVKYNDIVTVTANAGNFSYWADSDGQVVSRQANYTFTALQDVELTAVFGDPAPSEPVVYLSNVTGISPDTKSFLGYVEGDFIEYGLLASDKEEVLTLETEDVTVIPSKALHPETNEFLRSIPNDTNLKSFRAYAKLASGEVYYSDNNFNLEKEIGVPASDLFISLYAEGAPDNRKAIQIFNGTGKDVVLTGNYTLKVAANGGAWGGTPIALTGTIAHGDVFVVINNATDGGWYHDMTGNVNFNGDDAIGLFKNDVLIDVFGVQGEDPGAGWSLDGPGNGSDTVDKVVVRNPNVTEPTTEWNRAEWFVALAIPNATTDQQVSTMLQSFDWMGYSPEINTKLYGVEFIENENSSNFVSVEFNQLVTEPVDPIKEGHTFLGWFDENDNEFDFGTPITRHLVLTAKYEVNEYTITFDSAGGSSVESIQQPFGSALVEPEEPTREGYTFLGWVPDFPETMPSANIVLEAIWLVNEYSITFDVNEGDSIEPLTVEFGSLLTLPIPTKQDNYFAGWYIDEELLIPFEDTTMPANNFTLYAKWTTEVQEVTVSFDSNGGSNVDNQVVELGSAIIEPTEPTKDGYDFMGWYMDQEFSIAWNFEDAVMNDMTLYAQWSIKVYQIIFDGNNGSPVSQSLDAEHGAALEQTPTTPTRTGYEFVGWFDTNAETGGVKWIEETTFTSSKTYYARWESAALQATMTFGNDKYTGNDTSQNGKKTMGITGGGSLNATVTSSTAYWDGNSTNSLRLGSSKNPGSITLTFSENIEVTSVIVYASQYDGTVSISVNSESAQSVTNATGSAYIGYTFSLVNGINSITVSSVKASKTRIQIQSIVIEYTVK